MHDFCKDIVPDIVAHLVVYDDELARTRRCVDFIDVLDSIFRLEALK